MQNLAPNKWHNQKLRMHPNFYQRRLLRLFPLYITIHFLILTLALFVPESNITLASPKTLLSLLGLRFTDGLFFYINSSWWFIWLILQLYLIFPFMYALMQRLEMKKFLLITIAFTFIFRLLGILGVHYSHSLYYWMTGIFFGTRLAEFAVGMAIALYVFKRFKNKQELPELKKVFPGALLFYLSGLIASFTLPGSIVSNLLVTIGMSGIFYSVWMGLIKKVRFLSLVIVWIAVQSYSIYLIHQTPLKWTANFFEGRDFLHLFAALVVLILSFPAAWLIGKFVTSVQNTVLELETERPMRVASLILVCALLGAILFIDPRDWEVPKQNIYYLIAGILLIFLCITELVSSISENLPERMFRWTIISSGFLQIFILFNFKGFFL